VPSDATQLPVPAPTSPPDPASRLQQTERWLVPAAILGLLVVAALGWYWVSLARPEIVRDGIVTYGEASYWARSTALHGLTLAEAAKLIDGQVEPIGTGTDAARVPIQPIPGRPGEPWLELRLEAGRVVDAKLHR
jgi:hypothetical protein